MISEDQLKGSFKIKLGRENICIIFGES